MTRGEGWLRARSTQGLPLVVSVNFIDLGLGHDPDLLDAPGSVRFVISTNARAEMKAPGFRPPLDSPVLVLKGFVHEAVDVLPVDALQQAMKLLAVVARPAGEPRAPDAIYEGANRTKVRVRDSDRNCELRLLRFNFLRAQLAVAAQVLLRLPGMEGDRAEASAPRETSRMVYPMRLSVSLQRHEHRALAHGASLDEVHLEEEGPQILMTHVALPTRVIEAKLRLRVKPKGKRRDRSPPPPWIGPPHHYFM